MTLNSKPFTPPPNPELSQPEIRRIAQSALSVEQFAQNYQQPGVPVIITGFLKPEWRWNLDYLCQQLGDQEFVLRCYGRDRYQQDKRQWTTIGSGAPPQNKPFTEFANLLRQGVAYEQDIYLAKCPISNTPLQHTDAVQHIQANLRQLGLTKAVSGLNLWVGAAGHQECLHYDPTDGTLIQLYGRKRVILFPPSQTRNLYPFPVSVHLRHGMKLRSWFSQVYPENPDLQAFPNFRHALSHWYDVILEQGEALYIPVGWWHEVISLGDPTDLVCSLNQFWRVYPTRRAILSGLRWRAYLGSLCAVPHTLGQVGLALLSQNRQQKLKEIRQML